MKQETETTTIYNDQSDQTSNIPTADQIEKLNNIPAEMRAIPNWVLWKSERPVKQDGTLGKLTKRPYKLIGKLAMTNEPKTWTTFAKVVEAYRKGGYDGIGMACPLDGEFDWWGFDFDDAIDPETGEFREWPLAPVQPKDILSLDTYVEITPGGAGCRAYTKCKVPVPDRKKQEYGERNPITGKIPGVEMYSTGRFFAVTGNQLPGTPNTVNKCTEKSLALHHQVFLKAEEKPATEETQLASSSPTVPTEDDDDKNVIGNDFDVVLLAEDLALGKRSEAPRHKLILAITGVLISLGWKKANIENLIGCLVPRLYKDDPKYDIDKTTTKYLLSLDDFIERKKKGELINGWPSLFKSLGEQAFQTLKTQLAPKADNTERHTDNALTMIQMLRDQHLSKLTLEPLTYLVEPEVIKGSLGVFSGMPGGGKSTIVIKHCKYIAENNPDISILYLDRDNPQNIALERMEKFGGFPDNFLYWGNWNKTPDGEYKQPPDIDSPELDVIVRNLGKCMIVVDTIRQFIKGDENDNMVMTNFFKPLKKFQGYGNTVIAIHHQDKEGRHPWSGAGSLSASIDSGVVVSGEFAESKLTKIHCKSFRARQGVHVNTTYSMVNDIPTSETETMDDKLLALLKLNPNVSKQRFEEEIAANAGFKNREMIRRFMNNESLVTYVSKRLNALDLTVKKRRSVSAKTEEPPTLEEVFSIDDDDSPRKPVVSIDAASFNTSLRRTKSA